ncbi:Ankyrin repeat domain-containing protein 50 isoform 3 [Hibiscus syriacus]|uniref:Ankyrin repeat domain-containing protein 50 isoform 3 n=1 Tax=Hibiscus syriacus TaxID=106335 RepID=A0A6A2WQR3_HIBSY|nr:Ankyrin repeat domain-containing protein 50 isoform 3 [Hibiscus syriacus]
MQEVAGERGGYLHGRGALDSDDLLYLKEQMEAEEDAERLLRRTEKRAFAAFKISLNVQLTKQYLRYDTASLADCAPASFPLPLRVEPKPKSGIRQQDLLKKVVEVKPKRAKFSSPSNSEPEANRSNLRSQEQEFNHEKNEQHRVPESNTEGKQDKLENPSKSLLGLAYASSDDDEDD